MSSERLIVGDLTTIIKSYSAFGPNFSVILLVSSFDTGFSINQDSYLISLFSIELLSVSISKGIFLELRSG